MYIYPCLQTHHYKLCTCTKFPQIIQYTCILHMTLRTNRLTWNDGVIPSDEIWVKVGGDRVGKSMKMSFQICNVLRPNSVQNTCVFSVFEAKDSLTNLHVALDRYTDQIKHLQTTLWRYRYVHVQINVHTKYKTT